MPAAAAQVWSRVPAMGVRVPSSRHPREWGAATLALDAGPTEPMRVSVMPSGAKIRSRTKSSHDLPLTAATTWPATTNIRLL